MTKYEEIKDLFNKLLEGNKDDKQVKIIAEAQATLAEAEKEYGDLKISHEKFVLDYGELVKQVGTSKNPNHEDNTKETPRTLEDIIRDVTSKSKEEK